MNISTLMHIAEKSNREALILLNNALEGEDFTPDKVNVSFGTTVVTNLIQITKPTPFSVHQLNLYRMAPSYAAKFESLMTSQTILICTILKIKHDDRRCSKISTLLMMLCSKINSMDTLMELISPYLYELVRECVLFNDELIDNGPHPADKFIEFLKNLFESETRRLEEESERNQQAAAH